MGVFFGFPAFLITFLLVVVLAWSRTHYVVDELIDEDGGMYNFPLHFFIIGLFFKHVNLYLKAMEIPGLEAVGVMVAKAVMALWLVVMKSLADVIASVSLVITRSNSPVKIVSSYLLSFNMMVRSGSPATKNTWGLCFPLCFFNNLSALFSLPAAHSWSPSSRLVWLTTGTWSTWPGIDHGLLPQRCPCLVSWVMENDFYGKSVARYRYYCLIV